MNGFIVSPRDVPGVRASPSHGAFASLVFVYVFEVVLPPEKLDGIMEFEATTGHVEAVETIPVSMFGFVTRTVLVDSSRKHAARTPTSFWLVHTIGNGLLLVDGCIEWAPLCGASPWGGPLLLLFNQRVSLQKRLHRLVAMSVPNDPNTVVFPRSTDSGLIPTEELPVSKVEWRMVACLG